MAKVTTVTDDLDGSTGAETIRIRVGDEAVEIDLAPKNREKLMAALKPYFDKGRAVGTTGATSDTAQARAWLNTHGHKVNEKGRIPEDLMAIYRAQANNGA